MRPITSFYATVTSFLLVDIFLHDNFHVGIVVLSALCFLFLALR